MYRLMWLKHLLPQLNTKHMTMFLSYSMNASITFGTINPGILPILFVKPINVPAKSGAISTCVELNPLKQAPLNVTANINNVELAI
ncbi:hypothetical protein DERF_014967 [Dermatophagoides farinae]|uniref:Uncharacterized protein n=1 Tax=Dermatophagoides farinae TaxID=6954 RepID=A0A922HND1_DERFA|nr:hypothetical protein DERF_014967 [Dermatophagoides farinae]